MFSVDMKRANQQQSRLKVAVVMVAAVVICGMVNEYMNENKNNNNNIDDSIMNLSSAIPQRKWTIELETTKSGTGDELVLINSEDGKTGQEYTLDGSLEKENSEDTVTVATNEAIGDMICLCASGDDAWEGHIKQITAPMYNDLSKQDEITLEGSGDEIKLSTDDAGYFHCWRFQVDRTAKKLTDLGHSDACAVKEYSVTIRTDTSQHSDSRNDITLVNVRDFSYSEQMNIGKASLEFGGSVELAAKMSHGLGNMICLCATGGDAFKGYLKELTAPRFDDERDDSVTLTGVSDVMMKISTNDAGYSKCWRFDVQGWSKDELSLADAGGADSCDSDADNQDTADSLTDLADVCDASVTVINDAREKVNLINDKCKDIKDAIIGERNSGWLVDGVDSFNDALSHISGVASSMQSTGKKVEQLANKNNALFADLNRMEAEINTERRKVQGRSIDVPEVKLTNLVSSVENLEKDTRNFANDVKSFAEKVENFAEGIDHLPTYVRDLANEVKDVVDAVKDVTDTLGSIAKFGDVVQNKLRKLMTHSSNLSQKSVDHTRHLARTQFRTVKALEQSSETAHQLAEFAKDTADQIAMISEDMDEIKENQQEIDIQKAAVTHLTLSMISLSQQVTANSKDPQSLAQLIALVNALSKRVEESEKEPAQESNQESNQESSEQNPGQNPGQTM